MDQNASASRKANLCVRTKIATLEGTYQAFPLGTTRHAVDEDDFREKQNMPEHQFRTAFHRSSPASSIDASKILLAKHRRLMVVERAYFRETHIDALPITRRARDALSRMAIWYLEDLSEVTAAELRQQQGIGEGTFECLYELLRSVGLRLRAEELVG